MNLTDLLLRGSLLWLYVPGLFDAVKLLASVYLGTVLLYTGYLAYCTANKLKDSGRLAELPRLVRGHIYAIVYFMLLLDILFNVTVGSLVFWEWPEFKRLTFTARCKKWKGTGGKRGAVADYVCEGWLNPGEPGHC